MLLTPSPAHVKVENCPGDEELAGNQVEESTGLLVSTNLKHDFPSPDTPPSVDDGAFSDASRRADVDVGADSDPGDLPESPDDGSIESSSPGAPEASVSRDELEAIK